MAKQHVMRFYKFRDTSVGRFEQQRQHSEPRQVRGTLRARSVSSVVGDRAALGTENATTHVARVRRFDMDIYTVMESCGDVYKVIGMQLEDNGRFMTVALSYMSRCEVKDQQAPVFLREI